jgi:hypothetical protein
MVHVIFDGASVRLDNLNQSGAGSEIVPYEGLPPRYQRGYGYFAGLPRQRGHGIGDIFRSLWRVLKPVASAIAPMAKEAGKALGQEGLATGARVLNQLVEGNEPKDALALEGREGLKRLLDRASTRIQRGHGKRRTVKKGKRAHRAGHIQFMPGDVVTSHSIVGDAKRRLSKGMQRGEGKKRRRIDSLGIY